MDTINLAIVPFPIVVAEGNITAIGLTVDVLKDIAMGARFGQCKRQNDNFCK